MAKHIVDVGDKWCAMEVVDKKLYTFIKYFEDDKGQRTGGTEEYPNSVLIKLRCSCGNEREMDLDFFPGKRKMRDCGCGAGVGVGSLTSRGTDRGIIVTLYMPYRLHAAFVEHAVRKNKSLSRALVEFMEEYRPAWDTDVESTKESGDK